MNAHQPLQASASFLQSLARHTIRQRSVQIAVALWVVGNGLVLIRHIRELRGPQFPAALITADHDTKLTRAARRSAISVLHKPLRPAALRALLSAFKLRLARGSAA